MPHHQLDAERIERLFQAVDTGLNGSGLRSPVEIMVVGGAAVALQWDRAARTTYDIDVVSEGIPSVFWDVVEAVGQDEGLDEGWLNAAARVKSPTGPTPGEPSAVYVGSNLRVYGASPHYVLAMKLLTGRGIDRQDIPVLMEPLGLAAERNCTNWLNGRTRRLKSESPPATSSTRRGTTTPLPTPNSSRGCLRKRPLAGTAVETPEWASPQGSSTLRSYVTADNRVNARMCQERFNLSPGQAHAVRAPIRGTRKVKSHPLKGEAPTETPT